MHTLPKLSYTYNALEPHIDAKTMEIHHTKHHQAYIDNLNKAIAGTTFEQMDVHELLKKINDVPENIRAAVRNHGGGHANHSFFWNLLKKDVKAEGEILNAINSKFGSLEKFKEEFTASAVGRFGSGWAWLVLNNSHLEIMSTANQDSPLSEGKTPLLGIDVWEHAYYLKYQSRRNEYVAAFFSVINWKHVEENYKKAR